MNPLETYLKELRDIRATGAATEETSYYTPLANLLNEIGRGLSPRFAASCLSPTAARACPMAGSSLQHSFVRPYPCYDGGAVLESRRVKRRTHRLPGRADDQHSW